MPHHCHTDGNCHTHDNSIGGLRRYGIELFTLFLLFAGVILNHFRLFGIFAQSIGMQESTVILLYYIIAVLPVGKGILIETVKSWMRGDFFNEFSLMFLASIGAFVIGEYPEAVAILLFYSFGEKLEGSASEKAKNRIRSLLRQIPDSVRVMHKDGSITESAPQDVRIGDTIIVRPGERVALDGILENKTPVTFDNSAITGESVPVTITTGKDINSGALPIEEEAHVKVTKSYKDSSMSRIMKMIEDAATKKSKSETLLRRITRWYTPTVMILAVLLFAVPWIVSLVSGSFHFDWSLWFERSLVLLVCSCPCALVVSIPLSYFAAIGNASRFGLLFKGSRYLDDLRRIDTLLLDKTGTLTTGKFSIVEIVPVAGITKEEVLKMGAAIDSHSTHPLANAVIEAAGSDVPTATDVKTVTHGMTGTVDGKSVIVGSKTLLEEHGITVETKSNASSEICIAVNGKYIGSILLGDTLKPGVAETISKLHSLGIKKIMILSGDKEGAVAKVAKETDVDSYKSHLLPEDKHKIVEELEREGDKVAFVGDGINDAPSLALADVGIAIGTGGTDVAMESADAVITGNNIDRLVDGVKLSYKIKRVVTENVSLAIFVKILVMVLGSCGLATLWAAVFADTGITLITILWTLFSLRQKKFVNSQHEARGYR